MSKSNGVSASEHFDGASRHPKREEAGPVDPKFAKVTFNEENHTDGRKEFEAVDGSRKTSNLLKRKADDSLIPPPKRSKSPAQTLDKGSSDYQELEWEALKRDITRLVNKVKISNVREIARSLLQRNVWRARGILAESIIQAQTRSAVFSNVYAALVAVINSQFPDIGKFILEKTILQFRRSLQRENKKMCVTSIQFLAHLVNQDVADELIPFEILNPLLGKPTEDSVDLAILFLNGVARKLTDVIPEGFLLIIEQLQKIALEGVLSTRHRLTTQVWAAMHKDGFEHGPAVIPALNLVKATHKITHSLSLNEVKSDAEEVNEFKFDPFYEENENIYRSLADRVQIGGIALDGMFR